MKQQMMILAAGLLLFCGCGREVQTQLQPVPIPEDKIALVQEAEQLGRMIYEKDRHAAKAADIMLGEIQNPQETGIEGWVIVEEKDRYSVIFINPNTNPYTTPFQVVFEKDMHPYLVKNKRPATNLEAAMFRARQQALAAIEQHCSDQYNTVVLPAPDGQGWLAYALAASTDPSVIVAGGHIRVTVSPDGNEIISQRNFTNTCLQIPLPPDLPGGKKPSACFLTHLLDNVPAEIHVFLTLSYQIPCYVMTQDGSRWYVEDGKISRVQ